MRRGSNLPAVGSYNQTLVLDLIRRAQDGVSRTELTERTGLSAQTLSNVARRLVDEGWILEGEPIISGPGKPRTPLRLNPTARGAVGIHLDPAVDTFVLADLSGQIRARTERTPRQSGTAADMVDQLAETVQSLLAEAQWPQERILGVGVAAPGPLDADQGDLFDPPLLGPAWHNLRLAERLQAATGWETAVEKDVVAAMVGELWTNTRAELNDAIYLYYGAGIGAGVSVDGVSLRGRTGNAGDIAHLHVDADVQCGCGRRGCLGAAVAPEQVLTRAGMLAPGDHPTAPELRRMLAALDERAAEGDRHAQDAIDHTGTLIGRGIVQLNNLLDAEEVVIGGPLWPLLHGAYASVAHEVVTSTATATLRPARITESGLGTDVAAIGAACLVLDSVLTARPAGLMIASS